MTAVYIFGGFSILAIVCLFSNYHMYLKDTTRPILKYDEFKSNFNLNPDKWDIKCDWKLRYTHEKFETDVYINTLYGYCRARLDINRHYSKQCSLEAIENKHKLIEAWQEDIDEYKKKAYEEAKKQLKENSICLFTKDQEDLIKKAAIWYCQKLGAKNVEAITEKVAESITLDGILATDELDKIIK